MSDTGEEIGTNAGETADDSARGRRRKGRQGFSNPWLSGGTPTAEEGSTDTAGVPADDVPVESAAVIAAAEEPAAEVTMEAVAPAPAAPQRRVWRFGDEFATPAAEDKAAEPVVAPVEAPVEVRATVIAEPVSFAAEPEAQPSPPVMPMDLAEMATAVEPEPLPPLVLPPETVEAVLAVEPEPLVAIEPEPVVSADAEEVVHTAAASAAPPKSITPARKPWRESEGFANPWGAQSAEYAIEAPPAPAVEVPVAAKLKPTRIAAPPMPVSGAFAPKSAEKRAASSGVRRAETTRTVRVEGLGEGILSTINESLGYFMGISKRVASGIMAGSAALGRMGSGNDARANRAPAKKRSRTN